MPDQTGLIDLEVRGFWRPPHTDLPLLVVGRHGGVGARVLLLSLCADDVHAIHHEIQGQSTLRSQAVEMACAVALALSGEIAAAHLVPAEDGGFMATLEIQGPLGHTSVPIPPGPALAAAVRLGLPLRADELLLPPGETPVLAAPIVDFLDSLDLSALGAAD
jgi:bifunctional DNase/RNase